MNNKITINLGYKIYQIDCYDDEFTAVMNQHFLALQNSGSFVSTQTLLSDYLQIAYELRSLRRELSYLKQEQETLLNQLKDIE